MDDTRVRRTAEVVKECLRGKFAAYTPESNYMPFHHRLLGKDRMALYSFIHSLSTSFGTSIYEPVAVALGSCLYAKALRQEKPNNRISRSAQAKIQEIVDQLGSGVRAPDKATELEEVRKVSSTSDLTNVKLTNIDVFLRDHSGMLVFIDLKTAKPNVGGFKEYKRTLLE